MVLCSGVLGPKSYCSGKVQKQLYKQITDPSSCKRDMSLCSTATTPRQIILLYQGTNDIKRKLINYNLT
jgi:hypothetical protein